MPGPYNPPNPYGSYFNFGEYESAALSTFIPSQNVGLTPGTQALLGRPVGGFNPTPSEYLQRRIQNVNMANYMADIYRQDPRTQMFSNMLLQAMYSNEAQRRKAVERFGGMGNINEMMGFIMNQPGISGLIGGGPGAIGYGAYAAAASGMGVSGRLMMGDGPLVQQMARAISQQVNRNFFSPGGASLPGMTSGLDRNQIGGLMAYLASQGTFRDINIGTSKMTATGPLFTGSDTQLNAMTDRIKIAAKALGAIMDVYGNADVVQLMGKAQQITGLNATNPQNLPLMNQRLSELRRAANVAGMDVQTMYDAAASGVALSGALGGRGAVPGAVGAFSARMAGMDNYAMAGRSLQFGGFTPSFDERKAAYVRDLTAMYNDPIGMRYALFQRVVRAGGIQDERARAELQRMFDTHVSASAIDVAMRPYANMPALIRQFRGGPGIQLTANPDDANAFNIWANQNLGQRLGVNMAKTLQGTFGGRRGARAAFALLQEFEMPTIESMLTATPEQMNAILERTNEDRRDPMRRAVADVLDATGGPRQAIAQMRLAEQSIATDPFGTNFKSREARENAARNQANRVPAFGEDEARGFRRQTYIDGLINRATGTDEKTAFQRIAAANAGVIMGGLTGIEFPERGVAWTPEQQTKFLNTFQTEFSKTTSGRNILREVGLIDQTGKLVSTQGRDTSGIVNRLSSYESRSILFQGLSEYQIGGRRSYVETKEVENMQKYGGFRDAVRAINQITGGKANLPGWEFISQVAAAASFPGHPLYPMQHGRFVSQIPLRNLSAEEMDLLVTRAREMMAKNDYASFISAEKYVALTKQDRELGQVTMDYLSQLSQDQLSKMPAKEQTILRQTKEGLGTAGFSAKGELVMPEGAWTLNGKLKLTGDALELIETYVTKGKK